LSKFKERPKTGLTVEVRNGDFNGALRKFKKRVAQDGILMEYKEKQHYQKPSEKRAKAKAAGKARARKEQRKRLMEEGY
jgi:small subunit ribosomal protein S21